jgi:tetratricopeptide (TPR) repeat protein
MPGLPLFDLICRTIVPSHRQSTDPTLTSSHREPAKQGRMTMLSPIVCRTLRAIPAGLALLACVSSTAAPVATQREVDLDNSSLLELNAPSSNPSDLAGLGSASGATALQAISRGRWTQACNITTSVLARNEADVEALGIFAMCGAIRNDTVAANSAIKRLGEAEPNPYYRLLAQGILQLKQAAPGEAASTFNSVLGPRPGDPLALFFSGEALHAQHKDAAAVAAFKAVLKTWPDHTPALAAAARLLVTPNASKEDLKAALAMAERATSIAPTNTAYWRLLADLCKRTGQADRANAIALQYLSGPPKIK